MVLQSDKLCTQPTSLALFQPALNCSTFIWPKAILEGATIIQLTSYGVGKYGRCLGELNVDIIDGKEHLTLVNVNELLVKEGHAVEYNGGKR